MYLECVSGLREAFESVESDFSSILNEKSKNKSQTKKSKKKCKKSCFWQKFEFSKNALNDSKWWYMAWNKSPWCLRHVLREYLSSEHVLRRFWENRFFWPILQFSNCGFQPKNRQKPWKTAKNRQNRETGFLSFGLFQKNFCRDTSA